MQRGAREERDPAQASRHDVLLLDVYGAPCNHKLTSSYEILVHPARLLLVSCSLTVDLSVILGSIRRGFVRL